MSRNVTLIQLRTDIAAQCDFSTSSTGRYTPTLLNRIINQSIQRFRERISNEGMTHFLVPASGTLPPNPTSTYAFQTLDLSALSPSVVRTYGVDIAIGGVVRSLAHRPFTERNEYTLGPTMTGTPIAWAHFQTRSIAIMPAPDASYPYTVWYLPVLADLVNDSDTFDGVAGWEVWVLWDCVCQLIARDQYVAAYQQAVSERDLAWQDIVRSSTKVSAAGGAFVGRDSMGQAGLFGRGARREVAASTGSSLPTNSSVTNAMLVNRVGPIALGRLATTTGAVEDVPLPSLTSYMGKFAGAYPGLVPSGTGNSADSLRGDGTWGNTTTAASGLGIAQLAPIASPRFLGRVAAGSGVVQELTGAQVATLLPLFTFASKGLVPSGGTSGQVLGASGWTTGGGGGGGPTMLAAGPQGAVQYNGGSGFAGASGLRYDVATGLMLFGNLNMPTGTINVGATGLPPVGAVLSFGGDNAAQDVIATTSTAGAVAQLMQWNVDGPNIETLGRNIAVSKLWNRAALEHRWLVAGVDKGSLDAAQFSIRAGMRLGVPQLAHTASFDKLGAWTASGFANIATGIQAQASGMQLAVGTGGPITTASGLQMGGTNDIAQVRRINDAEGMKAFGNLSSANATGVVNVNAGSGTVFHLTASVSQLLALQPSAVHGDSILIQNRSAATHTVYNLGTGMGAPSGEIFKLNPSGAAWVGFASGAWELKSRYQLGAGG